MPNSKMRILVTGFPPFPDRPVNPSQELVEAVQSGRLTLPGLEFQAELLPVEYAGVEREFMRLIRLHRPDIVLSFGVGRQETPFRIERCGRNCDDAELPDNAGEIRRNLPISETGPDERYSPLDLQELRQNLQAENLDVEIGDHAGTYVCNHLLYFALEQQALGELYCPFVFTHLAPPGPSSDVERSLRAVRTMAIWFLNQQSTPMLA